MIFLKSYVSLDGLKIKPLALTGRTASQFLYIDKAVFTPCLNMGKLFFSMLNQRQRKLHTRASCCFPLRFPSCLPRDRCSGELPPAAWPASYPASGFHTNISSRRGHYPIRHAARVQVCRDIFSRPPRSLSVSRFVLAETKQFAWVLFLSQTGFWLISQGQGVKELLERIP